MLPDGPAFTWHGQEYHVKAPQRPDGSPAYMFVCPKCEKRGMLSGHVVEAVGGLLTCHPSVVCDGCGFHAWIRNGVATDC